MLYVNSVGAEIDAVMASRHGCRQRAMDFNTVHDDAKRCATLCGTSMTPTADSFHHCWVDRGFMSAIATAQLGWQKLLAGKNSHFDNLRSA